MIPYRTPLIEPFPYQIEAAQWAAQRRDSLIGDSPGLGKTASAIRTCDLVGAENILVVAPASVRIQWGREFERFSPMDRPMQICFPSILPNLSGVVILFYDQVVNHLERLMSVRWNCLILDEVHYLKSRYITGRKTSGYRTKAIYGFGKRFPGLITVCDRVIRLSGTPAPNHAGELYTHLKSAGIVDYPYWDYLARFCEGFDSEHGFRFTKHRNIPELQALLKPFMLRRTKAEVQPNLKEPMFETITVPRSDAAMAPEFLAMIPQLAQADAQLQEALSGDNESQLATLESMASSLATLRRFTLMAKLPAIAEQIEEDLTTNQIPKLVVFGIHKIGVRWLAEKLKRFHPLTISGDTPAEKRQPNIDQFQIDDSVRLIIGNIAAMGTGVDGLQNVCDEAIFCELDWVPSANAQAIMRLCRIGQKNPVRARVFSLYNSVDEHVQDTLTRKMKELAKIL
jgi:SNF2 family DNA or RNA helicase